MSSPLLTVLPDIAKISQREHNHSMEPFQMPSDQEIRAACAQGEEAVLALFRRSVAQLLAQVRTLEEPAAKSALQPDSRRTGIHQGDVYWITLPAPDGMEPGIPHPHVVVQQDVINRSRLPSVAVCALTSNQHRAAIPGNVLLEAGEANLPRPSVVEVSKVSAVDKTQFGEYIGALSA